MNLVEINRKGEYNLNQGDLKIKTRIRNQNMKINTSIETNAMAKVMAVGDNEMRHKCKRCKKMLIRKISNISQKTITQTK